MYTTLQTITNYLETQREVKIGKKATKSLTYEKLNRLKNLESRKKTVQSR